jgi:hypothetical protein
MVFSKGMCCDCTKSAFMLSKKGLSPLCNLKSYFCILSCFETIRVCVGRSFAAARITKRQHVQDFVSEIGAVLFSRHVFRRSVLF